MEAFLLLLAFIGLCSIFGSEDGCGCLVSIVILGLALVGLLSLL